MEEKSLRITGADKNFFNKITKTLTKILIPTQISLNGMRISVKRNALLKAFINLSNSEETDKSALEEKYEAAYTAYLESLDKYVLDSIYKKVKNDTASDFEKNALADYYNVTRLKETEYTEYKYRKQKYLLELDNDGIKISGKEKTIEKFQGFYIAKMDHLYKAILKNYSIKIADNTSIYDSTKESIYNEMFETLEEYINNILSLKITDDKEEKYKDIETEYEKYQAYSVGKLDTKDNIEKSMLLIGMSRKLFTHSIPLAVAEQCYKKILNDSRMLVQDTKIATKREKAYSMLLKVMETYYTKLLATKVYWEKPQEREEFKQFLKKYNEIETLKETDFIEYIKQKEVLFIKKDMPKLREGKTDYSKLIKYYKRKLVDYNAMKEIRAFKSEGKYKKRIVHA
ncbi:MAG: hypothetical protein IKF17_06020 [Clostridia bacterium]|nr:hypothetical protein [Clostridia bacterium]